jgi:hypothetical protein
MITDHDLHELWTAYNAKRRANSSTIKVPASSLGALLTAHHELYSRLTSAGKLAVTLGADHVSMVGELGPKDFEALAKAVDQRRAYVRNLVRARNALEQHVVSSLASNQLVITHKPNGE